MKKPARIRRSIVAMACGVGLFQVTLIGAGAYQAQGTPEADPGAPLDQAQSQGEDAGTSCEVLGLGPMAPGGITVNVTSTDDDGSSQTVTVSVDSGLNGPSGLVPVGGDVNPVPGVNGAPESTGVEVMAPATEDVSELSPAQATPAAPEGGASQSSPEAGEERSAIFENVPDDAAGLPQIQVDGPADVFCAVPGGWTEANAVVVPNVAPQDATTITSAVISPADAIAIAQSTATGEVQSLVLENDGDGAVYVITFDDQVIRINARTGEILPPEPQP